MLIRYLQKLVMWKLVTDFHECNPRKLFNNGNGK